MMFDLGLAMRKKEEFESARLMDFGFRLRVRAARLLARSLGTGEAAVARLVATVPESQFADRFAQLAETPVELVRSEYGRCLVEAHAQLVAEHGDPSPRQLA